MTNIITKNFKNAVLALALVAASAGALAPQHSQSLTAKAASTMVGGLDCGALAGFTYGAGIAAGFFGGTNVIADAAALGGGALLLAFC